MEAAQASRAFLTPPPLPLTGRWIGRWYSAWWTKRNWRSDHYGHFYCSGFSRPVHYVPVLWIRITLMRIRIGLITLMQIRILRIRTRRFIQMRIRTRIRILVSKKGSNSWKSAKIGSYSIHFCLTSANGYGSGSGFGSSLFILMRIRIRFFLFDADADPDPGYQYDADPSGSESTTLLCTFKYLVLVVWKSKETPKTCFPLQDDVHHQVLQVWRDFRRAAAVEGRSGFRKEMGPLKS